MTDSTPGIALTLGDPAGIGPELAGRLLADEANRRKATIYLLADREEVDAAAAAAGVEFPLVDEPQPGAVRGGGTVTIVMSHSMRELVFTAAALHALPASRGYELWLIGPAGDRAVIMLPPARHGMTGPVVASGLRPGDHLALTAEPAAGVARPAGPHPTTPRMLDIVL